MKEINIDVSADDDDNSSPPEFEPGNPVVVLICK